MESWDMLLEIILLLLGCLLAGSLMAWLKQSPLVGYLIAGMVLGGPGSLGIVKGEEHIESIAELGVALLLFSLGLEFSWKRVVGFGRATLLSGAAQVIVTLLAGAAACRLFGLTTATSLAIGAMICLSSTAAVLRVFIDRGEMDSQAGRNSLAILLVQDMAVVPLAILIPLLSEGHGMIANSNCAVKAFRRDRQSGLRALQPDRDDQPALRAVDRGDGQRAIDRSDARSSDSPGPHHRGQRRELSAQRRSETAEKNQGGMTASLAGSLVALRAPHLPASETPPAKPTLDSTLTSESN